MAAFDLAADGMEQERRFVEALQSYGQVWDVYVEERGRARRNFVDKQRHRAKALNGEQGEHFRQGFDLSDYPRFKFEYMSFTDRLELIWPDVLLLLMWVVVFFMASYFSFLRYNIH